jgi:hypothetical protein
MILPGWHVWICFFFLSLTLALAKSLLIFIPLTPVVLRVAAFDILDSCFFLLVVFLGLNPWRFAILWRFCNPSSDDWRLFSRPGTHNGCDKYHTTCLLPMDPSTLISPFPCYSWLETLCFRSPPRSFRRIPQLFDFAFPIVVIVAVSSPLSAWFVEFWWPSPFVVIRVFSIGKSVGYFH